MAAAGSDEMPSREKSYRHPEDRETVFSNIMAQKSVDRKWFTFKVGRAKNRVYRDLLPLYFCYFEAKFSGNFKDASSDCLDLSSVTQNSEAVKQIVAFINSDKMQLCDADVEDVCAVASFLISDCIQNICQNWLIESLNVNRSLKYYFIAHKFGFRKQETEILDYIRHRFHDSIIWLSPSEEVAVCMQTLTTDQMEHLREVDAFLYCYPLLLIEKIGQWVLEDTQQVRVKVAFDILLRVHRVNGDIARHSGHFREKGYFGLDNVMKPAGMMKVRLHRCKTVTSSWFKDFTDVYDMIFFNALGDVTCKDYTCDEKMCFPSASDPDQQNGYQQSSQTKHSGSRTHSEKLKCLWTFSTTPSFEETKKRFATNQEAVDYYFKEVADKSDPPNTGLIDVALYVPDTYEWKYMFTKTANDVRGSLGKQLNLFRNPCNPEILGLADPGNFLDAESLVQAQLRSFFGSNPVVDEMLDVAHDNEIDNIVCVRPRVHVGSEGTVFLLAKKTVCRGQDFGIYLSFYQNVDNTWFLLWNSPEWDSDGCCESARHAPKLCVSEDKNLMIIAIDLELDGESQRKLMVMKTDGTTPNDEWKDMKLPNCCPAVVSSLDIIEHQKGFVLVKTQTERIVMSYQFRTGQLKGHPRRQQEPTPECCMYCGDESEAQMDTYCSSKRKVVANDGIWKFDNIEGEITDLTYFTTTYSCGTFHLDRYEMKPPSFSNVVFMLEVYLQPEQLNSFETIHLNMGSEEFDLHIRQPYLARSSQTMSIGEKESEKSQKPPKQTKTAKKISKNKKKGKR